MDELNAVDALLREIDDSVDQDEAARAQAVLKAVARLTAMPMGATKPYVQFALAYSWYFHPRRALDSELRRKVDEHLNAVLRARPDDFHAWLYLGHNAYDCGDFAGAESKFEMASKYAPLSYLGLKAHEMLACARLRLHGFDLDTVENFVERAEQVEAEDVIPQALFCVLGDLVSGIPQCNRSGLRALLERLDRAGRHQSWFSGLL